MRNDAVLTGTLGIAMVILAAVARRIGRSRLLDRWRTLQPRAWAEAVRPAHRAWPFNWLILSRQLRDPLHRWTLLTPTWADADLPARQALRVIRFALVITFAGILLIAFGFSSSGT